MGVFTSQLKKLDWGMIIPAVLLVCFGLAGIWSTCVAKNNFSNFEKQIIFFDKSINKIIVGKTDINLPINKDKKGLPIELVISQINRKAGSQ